MTRISQVHNIGKKTLINTFTVLLTTVIFTVLSASIAVANVLSVNSSPDRRGSVTPGLGNIVMQTLTLKTDTGSASFTGVKINEYGTSVAANTIEAVRIYKETNGTGGLQISGLSDTLVNTPGQFTAEEAVFNLSSAQTITTTPSTFYIVYKIKQTAPTGTTIGSRLNNETYVQVSGGTTINAFTNLESREITLVQTPHGTGANPGPFSISTNLCQTCHAVHLAPDFEPDFGLTGTNKTRRILVQPYFESADIVNTRSADVYNALCFSCHDGTGASADIKSAYSSGARFAGHETTHTGSSSSGYKPPSGLSYSIGVKMPCMICHDVHTSRNSNYKMLADDLLDYAKSVGWQEESSTDNNRIDGNDEKCLVCHRRSNETSRTASFVMGIDLTMTQATPDHTTVTDCLNPSCHNNPHALN